MADPRMSQLISILARGARRALEVQRPQFSKPQSPGQGGPTVGRKERRGRLIKRPPCGNLNQC